MDGYNYYAAIRYPMELLFQSHQCPQSMATLIHPCGFVAPHGWLYHIKPRESVSARRLPIYLEKVHDGFLNKRLSRDVGELVDRDAFRPLHPKPVPPDMEPSPRDNCIDRSYPNLQVGVSTKDLVIIRVKSGLAGVYNVFSRHCVNHLHM